ncbi:hypothetical protein [Nonomuraea sp. NPDC003709]|uniref:hypothetical protein n=1 Tax=Nonomuraea sp. NPDC003709 TaxID=3154450 RepID=UPI0033BD77A6
MAIDIGRIRLVGNDHLITMSMWWCQWKAGSNATKYLEERSTSIAEPPSSVGETPAQPTREFDAQQGAARLASASATGIGLVLGSSAINRSGCDDRCFLCGP